MPYDAGFSLVTPAAAAVRRKAQDWSPTLFRRGEGLSLAVGGICVGAMFGIVLFFGFGRIAPWAPVAAALIAYVYAMRLAGLSMSDVIGIHSRAATALFGLHMAALGSWPLAIMIYSPDTWRYWIALPVAIVTLGLFLAIVRAPVRSIYRTSVHVSLIAAIAAYRWMWMELGA